MRHLVLVVAFLVGSTALSHAGLDAGIAAFERGDFAAAAREFLPLADEGNRQAQWHLSSLYHYGKGVPKDRAKAKRLMLLLLNKVTLARRRMLPGCISRVS